MYKYIFTLVKSIYGLLKSARCWSKEYINTTTLKAVFKKCKTNTCILYRVNEICTIIVIVYVHDTPEIGYKPAFVDTIEYTKK